MSVKAQKASDIQYESKIVWLSNIEAIPYVREHFDTSCTRRKGKLKYQSYEIVGYAELEDKAPNTGRRGCFARRVFWLAKHDRYYEPEGVYQQGCPLEAIDPLTVFPKVLGQITSRAWNGTLPSVGRKDSTDTVEELVLQLEKIKREMTLIEKAFMIAQESGANWSDKQTKLWQLHDYQYNETLDKIKNLIANSEKRNVENSEGKICVFARADIDADHNDVILEYEQYAAEAGLKGEKHVSLISKTYGYALGRETEIGFVLISKQLNAYIEKEYGNLNDDE
ncbi:DUF6009 family protein [Nostoc sp. FACHB-190]|uniref:DUF6009 family protein n=1 Tax=Nostoc sp. FACHB-190 TaxID=2692838 RepID=UPI001689FCE0|nr:DUF6009 family protein [Nostoc sp. FACHB-190]MBD2303800.1 hypothetical protein [Nostoc sp. FACHB-190]